MPLSPGRTLCLVGMLGPGPAVLGLPSQPAMPHCMPFVVVAGRNEDGAHMGGRGVVW